MLVLLLAGMPAAAQNAAAPDTVASGGGISVVNQVPLLELLAARDMASMPLSVGGKKFLATVVFDDAWDTWFSLKPADAPLAAGAWKESDLAGGAVYSCGGLELNLKETNGVVAILGPAGEGVSVPVSALFDHLYNDSFKITFGGIVTYSMFRNLAPLTENEGTASMRIGSDGLYYFSVTPDTQVTSRPRWLVGVNSVLYGLKVEGASLLFVSKPIDKSYSFSPAERCR